MRLSRGLWALLAFALVCVGAVVLAVPAHACSCVEPRAGLRAANAVFVARVVESDRSPDVGGPLAEILVHHRVEVESVYRGRVAEQTTVESYGGMCGPPLAVDRTYLIASGGPGRGVPYQSSLCSGTETWRPAARAEAEAAFGAPHAALPAALAAAPPVAGDLDPPAQNVWLPGPTWLSFTAAAALAAVAAWGASVVFRRS